MARASAFFASAQVEAKRKMNEVAVKFQAATGNGGYATQVSNLDCANNWYFARNGRCLQCAESPLVPGQYYFIIT
jgi:hypothetical protein